MDLAHRARKGLVCNATVPHGFVNPANARWVCSELVEEICHKNGELLHDALWVSGNTLAVADRVRDTSGQRHIQTGFGVVAFLRGGACARTPTPCPESPAAEE